MLNNKLYEFIEKINKLHNTELKIKELSIDDNVDNMIREYILNVQKVGNLLNSLYGEIDVVFAELFSNFSLVDTDIHAQTFFQIIARFITSLVQVSEECFEIEIDEIVKYKTSNINNSVNRILLNYRINKLNNKILNIKLKIPDVLFRINEFISRMNKSIFRECMI